MPTLCCGRIVYVSNVSPARSGVESNPRLVDLVRALDDEHRKGARSASRECTISYRQAGDVRAGPPTPRCDFLFKNWRLTAERPSDAVRHVGDGEGSVDRARGEAIDEADGTEHQFRTAAARRRDRDEGEGHESTEQKHEGHDSCYGQGLTAATSLPRRSLAARRRARAAHPQLGKTVARWRRRHAGCTRRSAHRAPPGL